MWTADMVGWLVFIYCPGFTKVNMKKSNLNIACL